VIEFNEPEIDCYSVLTLDQALARFKIKELKQEQQSAIQAVLDGKDTLAVMPTGYGKSLIAQLPGTMCYGVTLVLSPLIALMKDQVDGLNKLGIGACCLNSSLGTKQQQIIQDRVRQGKYKFIYCAPERLAKPDFIGLIQSLPIAILFLDEIHVMSEWQDDFRPAYSRIGEAIRKIKPKVVVATTATANALTIKDIERSLAIKFKATFVLSPDRPNLNYVIQRGNSHKNIIDYMQRAPKGRGIIYADTVNKVIEIYDNIKHISGVYAGIYHGQMPQKLREENQNKFETGLITTMVATNAFGLGVNYPDVRYVIHSSLPSTFEGFTQEAGRGGRDGLPALCMLCLSPDYLKTPMWLIDTSNPSIKQLKAVFGHYNNHKDVIIRDTAEEVSQATFGNKFKALTVSTCRAILRKYDLIQCWKEPPQPKQIKILKDAHTAGIPGGDKALQNIYKVFDWLRDWGVINENGYIGIHAEALAEHVGFSQPTVDKHLKTLAGCKVIECLTERRTGCTKVIKREFEIDEVELAKKKVLDLARFQAMIDFANKCKTNEDCHKFIVDYFSRAEVEVKQAVAEVELVQDIAQEVQYVDLW